MKLRVQTDEERKKQQDEEAEKKLKESQDQAPAATESSVVLPAPATKEEEKVAQSPQQPTGHVLGATTPVTSPGDLKSLFLKRFEQQSQSPLAKKPRLSPPPAGTISQGSPFNFLVQQEHPSSNLSQKLQPQISPSKIETPASSSGSGFGPSPSIFLDDSQKASELFEKKKQLFIRNLLSNFMFVTTSPASQNSELKFLPNLGQIVKHERDFNATIIENAIFERLSIGFEYAVSASEIARNPMEYIIAVYNKCEAEAEHIKTLIQQKESPVKTSPSITSPTDLEYLRYKSEILEKTMNLCVNYFGILMRDVDLFPCTSKFYTTPHKMLLETLLKGEKVDASASSSLISANTAISNTLLNSLNDKLSSEPFFSKAIENLLLLMSSSVRKMGILDEYTVYLTLLRRLTTFPWICEILVNSEYFLPDFAKNEKNGALFEKFTILGPFFNISCLPEQNKNNEKMIETYFPPGRSKTLTIPELQQIQDNLSNQMRLLSQFLVKIVTNLLKPATRPKMLKWLSRAICCNSDYSKSRFDKEIVSSFGFMCNLSFVLLGLFDPFTKKAYESGKIGKNFDPRFISGNDELAIEFLSEATKIKYTQSEFEKIKESVPDSFPTLSFFMAIIGLHIGYFRFLDNFDRIHKQLRFLLDEEAKVDEDVKLNIPGALEEKKRLEKEMERLRIQLWIDESIANDRTNHEIIGNFENFLHNWMLEIGETSGTLPETPSKWISSIPEFFLEDVIDHLLFIIVKSRFSMETRASFLQTYAKNFFVLWPQFLKFSENYVKSPYLRAKFVELMEHLITIPVEPNRQPFVSDSARKFIFDQEMMKKYFIKGIMNLFVEMEHTGSSHQFFDKFPTRNSIHTILEYIWFDLYGSTPLINLNQNSNLTNYNSLDYKNQFCLESKFEEKHLKLFNLLLNDSIYLLDQSIKTLTDIHIFQTERSSPTWNSLPKDARAQKEKNNADNERQASACLHFGLKNIKTLEFLSRDSAAPFLRPEMISRVAIMLNTYLDELAGPECQNLKVTNAEQLNFKPKRLLSAIVTVYMNLFENGKEAFVEAVVSDRSKYKPELFRRVINIISKYNIKTEEEKLKFIQFSEQLSEKFAQISISETELGEIPDEFCDPITYEIMKDPVQLPNGVVMDRPNIERHLLSDPCNPFTREPLTKEQLIPDVQLLQKIKEWKESKGSSKK